MWTGLENIYGAEWAFKKSFFNQLSGSQHCQLFTFETADGSYTPMQRSWFMARCNKAWASSNLGIVKGHGFRIGGTTHLLLLGVDPFIVMVQGHWKSTTFWRNCEEIIPTL